MTMPSERQWVTIGLFGLSIGMGLMALAQPRLWEIDTFKTVLQAIVITGLLNMVSAFHFSANKSDETKSENTARAFEAEGSVTRLKAAVTEQNAAVVAIEREANKRAADGVEALKQVEAANQRQLATITSLRNSAKLTYAKDAPCDVSTNLSNVEGL